MVSDPSTASPTSRLAGFSLAVEVVEGGGEPITDEAAENWEPGRRVPAGSGAGTVLDQPLAGPQLSQLWS
jgi:hypothetical protein